MENNILKKISRQIVDKRVIIMIAFLAACVYCALSISRVHVNNDITSFLPPDTDTRRGLTIMENEFTTYASANVMLANTTYERASAAAEKIETLEHVTGVTFDNSPAHFVDSAALLTISFDGTSDDENVIAAMNEIRSLTAGFDTYTSSDIGADLLGEIAQQMVGVVALAAVVIMAVLLFTSRSYFEVVIFLIVFSVAALLNMGTNFWLGEISSITNSIAVILQLALAIDYAIIFSHRYQDEIDRFPTEREALIEALSKSIVEISSSSLTTISGLVALMLMQFRLGYDLGLVLSKGILCSLITVFLLMPGLIASFFRPLRRTTHKSHVPDITGWGRFLMKTRFGFVAVFVIILPLAIWCSSRTEYAFNDAGIDELKYSESRAAARKITGTFANDTTIAVLVPSGNYEAEKQFLRDAAELDNVKTVTGLANIEIEDGKVLTDSYTPRMFSMLLNIDFEEAEMLYAAYGVENGQYQPIFGNAETYSVPLIDMFLFLFEKIDQGIVTLDADSQETLDSLRGELERGEAQLRGENWDRMVITADVPIEGDESVALAGRRTLRRRSVPRHRRRDERQGAGGHLQRRFAAHQSAHHRLCFHHPDFHLPLRGGRGAPRVRHSGQYLDQLYVSVPDTYPRVIRHEYDRLRHSDGGDDRLCNCYHESVSGSQKAPYAAGGDGAGGQRELSDRYDLRHHHDRCRHSDRIPRVGRIHRPYRSRRWPRRAHIGHPRFERSAAAHRAARQGH